MALLIPSLSIDAQVKDDSGHVLISLWKSYDKACNNDLPQDQLKALEAIKQEAAAKHLAWDWYDAARRFVNTSVSVNWKLRKELEESLDKEVTTLDEPIITYTHLQDSWSASRLKTYLEDNAERLKKSSNPEFYKRDSRLTSQLYLPALLPLLSNDYEYVLWSMHLSSRSDDLETYCKGKYPEEAFIQYTRASKYWNKSSAERLEALAEQYKGKAASLLPRQRLIIWRFSELSGSKTATQDDFKSLRKECEAFEVERRKFSGTEKRIADCCTQVADLIKTLDGKDISIFCQDDKLTLTVRNISSLKLQVDVAYNTVWETTVRNPKPSYYINDELKLNLPDLSDGDYTIRCKSGYAEEQAVWRKNTLSISMRQDSGGWGVFVADYMTGRPVESCTLKLFDADGYELASSGNFRPNGYSRLPQEISKVLSGDYKRYRLQASYTDKYGHLRLSGRIGFTDSRPEGKSTRSDPVSRARILTDRSAFNPGETVQFKAICYKGTYEYELFPEGQELTVVLLDPEQKEIDSKTLKTNEFGSVCGSFDLKRGPRGGRYYICLRYPDGSQIAQKDIRVDEFVLPTFEVKWDDDSVLHLPGDVINVSGKVSSYSGHSLSGANVHYTIARGRVGMQEGDLELTPDGRFSIEIRTDDDDRPFYYPVELRITDETGETLTFSTGRRVYSEPPLRLSLLNTIPGKFEPISGSGRPYGSAAIVRDANASFNFDMSGLSREGLSIEYKVLADAGGKEVASGTATPGGIVEVPIAKLPSGLYKLVVNVSAKNVNGRTHSCERTLEFVKAADSDTALNMDVQCFFREFEAEDIAMQIGTTDGQAWVVVELFGTGNELLDSQIVYLDGVRGKKGSLKTVSYTRKPGWSESLKLCAIFFHKGKVFRYTSTIELPTPSISLPLEFTRFQDQARPGEKFSLLIKTTPGVECAAAVFDKASETIHPNRWYAVNTVRRPSPTVYHYSECGVNKSGYGYYGYGVEERTLMSKASGVVEVADAVAENESVEEAIPFQLVDPASVPGVRKDFAATMAWEPALRSDAQGNIELKLTGADRLSTYYVQLFAHGEGMHNSTIRNELQVTIPVKLSIVEPRYLFEGDRYVARATIASNLENGTTGRVAVRFYDGADWRTCRVLGTVQERIDLRAGASQAFAAPFVVPEGVRELGVLLNFEPDDASVGSDAMFVTIPVYKPFQTLTEAHSALLLNSSERARTVAHLRSLFVNLDAGSLQPQERSILQMLKEAVPDAVEPKGKDVLSLTEAWYANILARRLGAPGLDDEALDDIAEKIAACQADGGGIAWFEGMKSSPVLTAAVLQRIYLMPEADVSPIDLEAAVKYLDNSWFEKSGRPIWCGGITLAQYLLTRAMYPWIPFERTSSKELRQFRKDVKAYLVPTGKRGMNGQILAKARRLRTLQLLTTLPYGDKLAKSWGISIQKKLRKSMDADIKSLLQYAVKHDGGGVYYPNAVMPWRGLLESELYAHSLLCDLFTSVEANDVAEGIRLWIMIQKETQHWEKDPAYIEAIASVMRGTPETLSASVILLSGSYTKPFEEVKAAGNGMTIHTKWFVNGAELNDGDILHVGDKLTARYIIHNDENRSFIRICSPRPASFRPVQQLSGYYGWWLSPLTCGTWHFSPEGYRNVLADKTEYWFDSFPEENTTISEEFFVTQEGAFQMPAIEIESLYAPHYRANGDGRGAVESR